MYYNVTYRNLKNERLFYNPITSENVLDLNTSQDIASTSNNENYIEDNSQVEIHETQDNSSPDELCNLYLLLNKDKEMSSHNFLFDFPEKIKEKYPNSEPFKLLANTFSYLVLNENELFQKFCEINGAFDSLIDHYVPFINTNNYPKSNDNEMRFNLMHTIHNLFLSYPDMIGRYVESIKDFFSILIVIIDKGELLSQIEAFRCITKLYSSNNHLFTPRIQRLWLFRIVAYCPPSSPLQLMAVNFVSQNYTDDFQFMPLCNVLIKREIEEGDSLRAFEAYLNLARDEDPFDAYIFLFKILIEHPYLGRSAVEVICNTIKGFIDDDDENILNYVIFLFRKVLIFYAFANKNNRYEYRQYLIELMYQKIVSMKKIQSFKKSIQSIVNAMIKNDYLQNFEDHPPENAGVDEITDSFLKEKGLIVKALKNLKLFALYPFDSEIDSALVDSFSSDQTDSEDSNS